MIVLIKKQYVMKKKEWLNCLKVEQYITGIKLLTKKLYKDFEIKFKDTSVGYESRSIDYFSVPNIIMECMNNNKIKKLIIIIILNIITIKLPQ